MGVRTPDAPKQSQRRTKKGAPRDTGCRMETGRGSTRMIRMGTAVLGEKELRFHTGRTGREGKDFFLHLRYEDIRGVAVDAHAGMLTITTADSVDPIVFHLGRHAADWKKMIEDRPTRLDELGVKPTSRLALISVDDELLERELAARVKGFAAGKTDDRDNLDFLFVGAEHRADLPQLKELARRVRRPGGAIWLIYPTGSKAIQPRDIIAAAAAAGLVDAISVELSATLTAFKLTRM